MSRVWTKACFCLEHRTCKELSFYKRCSLQMSCEQREFQRSLSSTVLHSEPQDSRTLRSEPECTMVCVLQDKIFCLKTGHPWLRWLRELCWCPGPWDPQPLTRSNLGEAGIVANTTHRKKIPLGCAWKVQASTGKTKEEMNCLNVVVKNTTMHTYPLLNS